MFSSLCAVFNGVLHAVGCWNFHCLIFSFLCQGENTTTCSTGWEVKDRPFSDTGGYLMVSPDTRISCSGLLTQWKYYTKIADNSFTAIVLRPINPTEYKVVGFNNIPSGPPDAELRYNVPENEQIKVEANDVIGWTFPHPRDKTLQATDTAAGTQILWLGDGTDSNYHDNLQVDQVYIVNGGARQRDYSLLATVEGM